MARNVQTIIDELLALANIKINGTNPWDIQVHDKRFYQKVYKNPSLGAGESYMDGWWDCAQLDELFYRISVAQLYEHLNEWNFIFEYLKHRLFNMQTPQRSLDVAHIHYDLDNELYADMLGPTMAYTCGYWRNAADLDHAQNQKYELICRKLNLQSTDEVLELGCGWGGFARYAATHYGCTITAVNISVQQVHFARQICIDLPVHIHLSDYRDSAIYNAQNRQFDKVVSIGMCEHVGSKNYVNFIRIVHEQLKNNGLFLLHTIGSNKTMHKVDPWINKYIFPHGSLPSINQLGLAMEEFFIMEDWHNFGADYDKTLMAWHANFLAHWPELSKRFDQRFYRMWSYYLLSCAGMFRARDAQLWQIVLSKGRGQSSYFRVS